MKKIDSNYVFEKRIKAKENIKKNHYKLVIFIVTILVSFAIILFVFLSSDKAKIYKVTFKGNKFLTNEYLKNIANFEEKNYYMTTDFSMASKVKKDPLIEDVKVRHSNDNVIVFDIVEKRMMGYVYEDIPYIIDENANKIAIDERNQYLIAELPYIVDFKDDDLVKLANHLKSVNQDIVSDISEIRRYQNSYDENALMAVLRDGNYIFLSIDALELINNYYGIDSNLKKRPACIYFDETTRSAYTSGCPWENNNKEVNNEQ